MPSHPGKVQPDQTNEITTFSGAVRGYKNCVVILIRSLGSFLCPVFSYNNPVFPSPSLSHEDHPNSPTTRRAQRKEVSWLNVCMWMHDAVEEVHLHDRMQSW